MARMVKCIKLDKEAEGMDFAPLPGNLGKKIWNQVSKEAWAAWLKHQTIWLIPVLANTFSSKLKNTSLKVALTWPKATYHLLSKYFHLFLDD
jgi:Fe-S cluster biosynthesis and repair protein YggX